MAFRIDRIRKRRLGAIVSAAIILASAADVEAKQGSALSAFVGSWAGGGSVLLNNGSREQVRCRANYAGQQDDGALRIDLTCASDSYKVHVVGNVAAVNGGAISGTWQELTRDISGKVEGRIPSPGRLQANLLGAPYVIQLSFNTQGNQQTIAMQVPDSDVRSVEVNLRRS